MKIPKVYSEWCEIFDKIETWEIGHQDSEVIKAIDEGEIRWVSGVAERITQRLLNLINNRMTKLQTFFSNRIAKTQNQFDAEQLLLLFRKELFFIKHLENLKMLPEDLRKDLSNDLSSYAKQVQTNLENNAKNDLSGTLKRIITNIKLDKI